MKRSSGLELWCATDANGFGLRDFFGAIVFFLGLFFILGCAGLYAGVLKVIRTIHPPKPSV